MMRKSIFLAAFAATLLSISGMGWAATPVMNNVVADDPSPATGDTTTDIGISTEKTVAVQAASAITGADGTDAGTGSAGVAGGSATYTVDETHTLSAGTGMKLTITGGNGGAADATDGVGGAGGAAFLVNKGTITFDDGSTLVLVGGDGGTTDTNAGGKGGDVTITNNADKTISFMAGSTVTVTPGTANGGGAGTINFANSGSLQIDANVTGISDLLGVVTNTGNVLINGTMEATIGDVTMTGGTGTVTIAVISNDTYTFGEFDAGGSNLVIAPVGTNPANVLAFTGAVSGTGTAAIPGGASAVDAITIAAGSFVDFQSTVAAVGTNPNIAIGNGAMVGFGDNVTGNMNAMNGSRIFLNDAVTITNNVTLNSSMLVTFEGAGTINGTLTTTGKSVISIGNASTGPGVLGAIYGLTVGTNLELSLGTSIFIEKDNTLLTTATNVITVTGTSNATDWVAANAGITGSAIQNYAFGTDVANKNIQVVGYEQLDAYGADSQRNIVNRMNALGINNAASLVDNSFGQSLFNVATGDAGGNFDDTIGIGINSIVAEDPTSQAYQNASTTWSVLRAFGGMTGGYSFSSGVEANSAASAMTGQNQAAAVSSMISITNNNINSVNNRIAANNVARAKVQNMVGSDAALAAAMLNCNFANRFWVGGLGMWENAGSRDGSNGYKLDTWGLMTGYDHVFGPITVGGAFGYSRGSFKEKDVLSNDSKINNYAFNLYATYNHSSGFFASILGGYAYSDVNMNRNVLVNGYESSSYHVNTWNIGGNIGYDWKPVQNLTITPRVGLYYIHAKSSSIGGNYTSIQDLKDYATQMPVDLSVTYRIPMANGGLDLTARGGYAYNFNNSGAEGVLNYNNIVGVAPVSVKGRTPGHHTWNVGGGIKYQAGRFDVGVNYDYYKKSSYHAHRVTGVVGVSF